MRVLVHDSLSESAGGQEPLPVEMRIDGGEVVGVCQRDALCSDAASRCRCLVMDGLDVGGDCFEVPLCHVTNLVHDAGFAQPLPAKTSEKF